MSVFPATTPRPLALAHATPVAALIREAFAALPASPDPPMSALRIRPDDIVAHLATGGGAVVAADKALVGSILWVEKNGGLYLSRVAVAPAWRRRGIARSLVAAAETAAEDLQLPRLHLSTRLVLTGNRRLFASCGFVETTRRAHPGYDAATSVEMEKWLDGRGR